MEKSIKSKKVAENLKIFRKLLGLKQKEFAIPLGITHSYISNVEREKNNLSDSILHLIKINYRLNENWLLTGEGTPFVEEWLKDKSLLFENKGGPIKEFTQNLKLDLAVITQDEADRRKKATADKLYNIDPSNPSTPSSSSVDAPCANPWQGHIAKTQFVLESKTGYSKSLAANIESFYDAVVTAEKLIDHENRLAQLEKLSTVGREKEEDSDAALTAAS